MQWQSLGFKADPLNIEPITMETLDIYTGHIQNINTCLDVLMDGNRRIVIEGPRGVGTTSFANFLRFSLQAKKIFFTPRNEIRVNPYWQLETLLSTIVTNLVREMELFGSDDIINDKRFQNAQALSIKIAETYRNFGVDAFTAGLSHNKSAKLTNHPILVPANILGHHLEDLCILIKTVGYKKGIIIQLDNLDVGKSQDEIHLKHLFNALRDYIQIDGLSWLLVGDIGLRQFITQYVDRLDDIISFELNIDPLSNEEFKALIDKRARFYRANEKVELPIEIEVFLYLFTITKGRLRYVFGLLFRLMQSLHIGDLTDRITLEIAQSMLVKLGQARIERIAITPGEKEILKILVQNNGSIITDVAKEINKSTQYVGRILNKLLDTNLVTTRKCGVSKYYTPSIDAIIAYSIATEKDGQFTV
jgi:hypothetical protein